MTQNKRKELARRIKRVTRNTVEYWLPIVIICIGINLMAALIKSELYLSLIICSVFAALIVIGIMVILNNILVVINFFVNNSDTSDGAD